MFMAGIAVGIISFFLEPFSYGSEIANRCSCALRFVKIKSYPRTYLRIALITYRQTRIKIYAFVCVFVFVCLCKCTTYQFKFYTIKTKKNLQYNDT